ncbi:hypothetical protein KUT65_42275, partial [Pseudomonas aeruginosa]|nr:hypothetical protein [Pseudomonas aeruginosa]
MVHSPVLHGLCRGGRCGAVVHARHRAVVHGRVLHAIVLRGLDGIRQAQQQTQGEGTAGQAGGF